ncbi:MAG: formate dehydrogenase subunit gamma [Burkholderiales bacterium]|nr:formate dehydrogenase subunit gamma [Burkholderiales bacterium]
MNGMIRRYTDSERINHWIVAILFILSGLSGLALFHPATSWLAGLFGGGPWTRVLHPFFGVFTFVAFLAIMARFWHHNMINQNDRKWLTMMGDVIANRDAAYPEVGKYNAAQKLLFWTLVTCMILLFVTGFLFWRPWFAQYFPIGVVRLGALVHSLVATVAIIAVIVHIYAAIWVKGAIGGMTTGWVSEKWARVHHPGWYREVTRR